MITFIPVTLTVTPTSVIATANGWSYRLEGNRTHDGWERCWKPEGNAFWPIDDESHLLWPSLWEALDQYERVHNVTLGIDKV